MLRIYVLQHLYNLADDAARNEIIDSRAFSQFCGVDSSNQVPDGDTIGRFRHILEQNQLGEAFFTNVVESLQKCNLMLKKGTIVDSTLIAAPSSTKNKEKQRDPEAHSVKKGNQWYFGYKEHIGVDADSGYLGAEKKNDAILELRGSGRESDYSKLDYMNMSIASNSDGIILQYSGEQGLEEKINEAVQKGIPVVTVMGDAVHSKRQSFVGVSDYQLGSVYGEKVAEYVTEDTESILILLKKNIDDMNQSQIYTQISNAVQAKAGPSQNIQITGKNLRLTGTFETEEAVTDIFQQRDKVPDILVCMDEETTECARQAVLDFNLAGKVTIIGYYSSEDILTAVEKGVISVTCDVDTEQLGRYSIEALTAYQKDGRTNSYYNVDINFLDKDVVREMRRKGVSG